MIVVKSQERIAIAPHTIGVYILYKGGSQHPYTGNHVTMSSHYIESDGNRENMMTTKLLECSISII